MRSGLLWISVFALLLSGWAAPPPAAQPGSPNLPVVLPPLLTALSPSILAAGGPGFTLTVAGLNFTGATQLAWNGDPHLTTLLSPTRLSLALSAAEVAPRNAFTVSIVGQAAFLSLNLYDAFPNDADADAEQGQPNFSAHDANNALMLPANQLNNARAVAVDAVSGRLYVADAFNHRVLSWPTAAAHANGQAADVVIGQPNFTSIQANVTGAVTPTAASLNGPLGVAVDGHGRLYVADWGNNRVLEFDTPLTNTTADRVFGQPDFAAYLSNGDGGGTPTAGTLSGPVGVAVDAQDRLYVADAYNNRVVAYATPLTSTAATRVFGQPNFVSSTFNLTGVVTPTAASLNDPTGVALDPQGELYIADTGNNRVLAYATPQTSASAARVWGQLGSFTTAAHPPASANSLRAPSGLALDTAGNLYVADSNFNRVLEFDQAASGDSTADRVFGQAGSFTATQLALVHDGSLNDPTGLALDAQGNLLAADSGNSRVLEYDQPIPALTSLSPSTVAAGSPDFTLTLNGSGFWINTAVTWNGSPRSDLGGITRLQAHITAADVAVPGVYSVTVAGGTPPLTVTVYRRAAGDTTADTVQGQPNFTAASPNNPVLAAANTLAGPSGVAVDARTGRLFVADATNNRVLSWPSAAARANGQAADLLIGQPGFSATSRNITGAITPTAASLNYPISLALDAQGGLYIADANNNRVLEYDTPLTNPVATRVFGQPDFTSSLPNATGAVTPTAASLNYPLAVALDAQGRLYVADAQNNRVLEYATPLGSPSATRVFGQPDFAGFRFNRTGSVFPTAASLNFPDAVVVAASGQLYVADVLNARVLVYSAPQASATADRVFGQGGSFTTVTFGGPSADNVNYPAGLALDARGNLFVADGGFSRVLEYDAAGSGDTTADRVFGQAGSFTTNHSAPVTAGSLNSPAGLALDPAGNLFVADWGNHRVLEIDAPLPPLPPLFLPLVWR